MGINKEDMLSNTIYIFEEKNSFFAEAKEPGGEVYSMGCELGKGPTIDTLNRKNIVSAVSNTLWAVETHGKEKLKEVFSGKLGMSPNKILYPVVNL